MFDAYDPEFLADPYPTYARLRRESPVFFDEAWDLTFVTRHQDVDAILKDRNRFGRDFRHRLGADEVDESLYQRIYPSQWPTWTRYIRDSFIDLEPPRHTRLRRLVSKAFTRRSSESFRPRLEEEADRIVEEALGAGRIEVISDLATPIPVRMIADLMGIPEADHPRLLEWSHAIVRVFDERVTADEGSNAESATREFVTYLEELVAERRARPGDDLVSAMLEVEDEGEELTDFEIVATSILTLNAGHEATVHAIGNAFLALASDEATYRRLVEDRSDLAGAADELLRYDAPLQMFERWALEDVEIDGHIITRGTKVGLLFGSANRDELVFEAPDEIRLDRSPNPHIAFGAGVHHCVGAPLARVELETALGSFAARVKSIDLVSATDRIESLVFRGVGRIELALEAA